MYSLYLRKEKSKKNRLQKGRKGNGRLSQVKGEKKGKSWRRKKGLTRGKDGKIKGEVGFVGKGRDGMGIEGEEVGR